ncbi:protein argonaute 4A-like [Lolium rigidum]|uniref:protein argonaute 4A-like n=1 Tax=Lolium rigidum TaxID=89674 RepID=UPI001F5DB826|nr:protein argonaute 4A-like [Lolium rigidum]
MGKGTWPWRKPKHDHKAGSLSGKQKPRNRMLIGMDVARDLYNNMTIREGGTKSTSPMADTSNFGGCPYRRCRNILTAQPTASTRRRGTHSVNSSGFLGDVEYDYCLPLALDVKMEGEEEAMRWIEDDTRDLAVSDPQASETSSLADGVSKWQGDPSKPPASDGGKGDPSKSPVSDGGKGGSSMTAKPQRLPIKRPTQHATKGRPVMLLTNHFKVSLTRTDQILYHYDVTLKYDDGELGEGVRRKVMKQLYETYASHLAHKVFAYDGEKGLFTVGPLPFKNNVFDVVLCDDASSGKTGTSRSPGGDGSPGPSDKKRMKRAVYPKRFKVEIASTSAARIPMSAIAQVLRGGQESENSQEAIRVLDIILRQHSARQGCLLVRESFFRSEFGSIDVGSGVIGCRGFHSSFRPTQNGLSLNFDLSTTMVVRHGPVIDFLLFNQNIKDCKRIDWGKAKRALNNLWIKTTHRKAEFKIVGLSEKRCYEQKFSRKQGEGNGTVEVTVYDYYMDRWSIKPDNSADLPCLIVGEPDRPTYLPLELCHLLPLQRYKKSLSTLQRSKLVEGSRQKPRDRMSTLSRALRDNNYDTEPMLRECGISISRDPMKVEGRVLQAPQLSVAHGRELYTPNGRWNFNNDRFIRPIKVTTWGVVNFSARCNVSDLIRRLMESAHKKGIQIDNCGAIIEEGGDMRRERPAKRVEAMFKQIQDISNQKPAFLLCLLPEKNCDIYGPWKRECLAEHGIFTQCLVPPANIKDQYLTNVLLKINAKLGGLNSQLKSEINKGIPLVSTISTIIFGMDVSHGSPGRSDVPSVAAVVSSLEWPNISKYRASVCTQAPRLETIDNLFKQVGDNDQGLIKASLLEFYKSSRGKKPEQIIIFRDGVGESQFDDVLNTELADIIEACKFLDDKWLPKFTVIVAQKNHHTRFFPHNDNGRNPNVQPGTVVDDGICHPSNYDFYMCAHYGMIGTTRPTHYQVLHDEIGFSPDELQELVHSLSYVYQRSTTAISVVAPIYYAHLAAAQVAKFTRLDDMSETSSSHATQAAPALVPELPRLHDKVASSMFFC